MESRHYYLAFSYFMGIGPVRFSKLVAVFGSVKAAYGTKPHELKDLLGPSIGERFIRFRSQFDTYSIENAMIKNNVQVVTLEDENYPQKLKEISDPPICLYIRGNKNIFIKNGRCLAIVGTRKHTLYGSHVTSSFAASLSRAGFIIVSGMALGIDGIAHRAVIEAGGLTVAVLGCGVDIVYPPAHQKLYRDIISSGGAVISEFPPGHTVQKGLFVARNRIITGISDGVLIVEGASDSGSLITARYAAEQGRDVFAPPSPITSPMSQAPNLLIKQGAKMVTDVNDILEEYNMVMKSREKEDLITALDGVDRQVFEVITTEPVSADDLSLRLKIPINEILNSLSLLEIKGHVKKDPSGYYYSV